MSERAGSTKLNHQTGPQTDKVERDRGSGFAAQLERDRAHREKARNLRPILGLIPFVVAYPGLLVGFVFFLVLASMLTLLLPYAFRLVVDCGFGGATMSLPCTGGAPGASLSLYFLAGMIVAALLGISSALRFYFIGRLGERVVADLRKAVYAQLLNLNQSFFARTSTGEVVSRLTTDTTLIQTVVGSSISIAIRTVATTSGALFLMVVVNWKLALMVLALGPMIIGPITLFGRRVQRLSRRSQDHLAAASARASESLRAIDTVQVFTREREEYRGFDEAIEATFRASLRRITVRSAMTAVIFTVVLSGLISVLWFGAIQVKTGAMTPGAMTQFVMYAFVAVSGVGMLSETYTEIMRAAGATERLMEILQTAAAIRAPESPLSLQHPLKGHVALCEVSFSYPSRPGLQALRNISLGVAPGETVAVVGASGAGKSTLFQLISRLYDPDQGRVLIDSVDLRELDPAELRQQLAVVQQNAPLFSGTVAENIRFGRPEATEDEVEAAARAAYAHEFIMALDRGYQSRVGEGGANLSGGQRQRLAIARAILRDAPILLLDEATSALDSESEQAISQAVSAVSRNRTTLIIAHRLSTVRNADRIIVMEDGEIIDQGTHAALLARGGLYARYIELQFTKPPQPVDSA